MTNALFIHIPKTAGRSILKAMGVQWSSAHPTIAQSAKADPTILTDAAFKFACVRNPWDRVVSLWLFFGHMGMPSEVKPFDKWLLTKLNWKKRTPSVLVRPIMDQMWFCKDDSGVVRIDEFLRFENVATDFAKVASRLGISQKLPALGTEEKAMLLQVTKPGPEKDALSAITNDYHAAYTSQELIDAVAFFDSETIKRFGYSYP